MGCRACPLGEPGPKASPAGPAARQAGPLPLANRRRGVGKQGPLLGKACSQVACPGGGTPGHSVPALAAGPSRAGTPELFPAARPFLPLAESTDVFMECSCCDIRVMTAHEAHRLPRHVHFVPPPIPNPPPATDAEHQVKTTKGSRWGRVSVISSLRPKWPKIRHSLGLEAHGPT